MKTTLECTSLHGVYSTTRDNKDQWCSPVTTIFTVFDVKLPQWLCILQVMLKSFNSSSMVSWFALWQVAPDLSWRVTSDVFLQGKGLLSFIQINFMIWSSVRLCSQWALNSSPSLIVLVGGVSHTWKSVGDWEMWYCFFLSLSKLVKNVLCGQSAEKYVGFT